MQRVLEKICIGLSAFVLALNMWIGGLYGGFVYGANHICEYSFPNIEIGGARYWMSHADPYDAINYLQILINWALLIYVVVKLFEKWMFVRLLLIIPLIASVFWWHSIYRIVIAELGNADKYIDLLRQTTNVSWLLLSGLIVLTILQILTTILELRSNRSNQ